MRGKPKVGKGKGPKGPRTRQHKGPTYELLKDLLAANVLRLRAKRGLSQERAAELCGFLPRHLQKIEDAELNSGLTTIARLCDGFRVGVGELFRARPGPRPAAKRRPRESG